MRNQLFNEFPNEFGDFPKSEWNSNYTSFMAIISFEIHSNWVQNIWSVETINGVLTGNIDDAYMHNARVISALHEAARVFVQETKISKLNKT